MEGRAGNVVTLVGKVPVTTGKNSEADLVVGTSANEQANMPKIDNNDNRVTSRCCTIVHDLQITETADRAGTGRCSEQLWRNRGSRTALHCTAKTHFPIPE